MGRQIISSWRAKIFFQDKVDLFIKDSEIQKGLSNLGRQGLAEPIRKGKKSLWEANTPYLNRHQNIYELANEAFPIGTLCYSSAFECLKLSDQRSNKIHLYIPRDTITNIFEEPKEIRENILPPDTILEQWQLTKSPNNINLKTIWDSYTLNPHGIKNEWLFGTEIREVGGVNVRVSTLERTLIDGLKKPEYSGGLNEVFRAWVRAIDDINMNTLVSYIERIDSLILYQRVGFVAEKLGLSHQHFPDWKQNKSPRGGSRLLNPHKDFVNDYDPDWNISINHPISILENKDADYS
jgi:predicted transcriptional regulator of viral defense system